MWRPLDSGVMGLRPAASLLDGLCLSFRDDFFLNADTQFFDAASKGAAGDPENFRRLNLAPVNFTQHALKQDSVDFCMNATVEVSI